MLSRLVITFPPRSKHLLISWLQSPSAVILEPKKISLTLFPLFLHLFAMKWWDQMPWSLFFLILSFNPAFSLSYFTLIKSLFCSSSLSAIRVVSSAYLRLLLFFPATLIPAGNSFRLAFHVMCSACKFNKQGDNKQPCCTPFSILNQTIFSRLVLFLLNPHTGFSGDR